MTSEDVKSWAQRGKLSVRTEVKAMGRKLRRVPLDFNWPLNKPWKGYVSPKWPECSYCNGSGASPEARKLEDEWYGHGDTVFSPSAYGATVIPLDHPLVLSRAINNIASAPDYYLHRKEQEVFATAPKTDRQSLIDFVADNPVFSRAISLESYRFWHQCIKGHWCHHLIQADVDALIQDDRLWDFTRRPLNPEQEAALQEQEGSKYWLKEPNGYTPTAEEINLWSLMGIGHDTINQHVCVKARCLREGVPYYCNYCQGNGSQKTGLTKDTLRDICADSYLLAQVEELPEGEVSPEVLEELEDSWEEVEPPNGEGYQLWYDSSPISPVFTSLEDLCAWAADNTASFGSQYSTKEQWLDMLTTGFVCHHETLDNGHEVTFVG